MININNNSWQIDKEIRKITKQLDQGKWYYFFNEKLNQGKWYFLEENINK